eukprot:scaffold22865_cov92-Isochrysis_galbana.AAC.5
MARAACSRTEKMRPSVRPETARCLPATAAAAGCRAAAPPLPLHPLRFFAAISSQSCRCTATAQQRRCSSTGDHRARCFLHVSCLSLLSGRVSKLIKFGLYSY